MSYNECLVFSVLINNQYVSNVDRVL